MNSDKKRKRNTFRAEEWSDGEKYFEEDDEEEELGGGKAGDDGNYFDEYDDLDTFVAKKKGRNSAGGGVSKLKVSKKSVNFDDNEYDDVDGGGSKGGKATKATKAAKGAKAFVDGSTPKKGAPRKRKSSNRSPTEDELDGDADNKDKILSEGNGSEVKKTKRKYEFKKVTLFSFLYWPI